jgi:hypothetical protein
VREAMTRLLGPEHPDTLTSMGNLAQTLYARGDLEGAQRLFEQVLEARTRILGPKDPGTEEAAEVVKAITGQLHARNET